MLLLLLACKPPVDQPCNGLDLDLDGVCDRERADFSRGAAVPMGGRANIYQLDPQDWQQAVERGFTLAHDYPVEITGVLLPYAALDHFFDPANDEAATMRGVLEAGTGYSSLASIYDDVGLIPFDDGGPEPWAQPPITGVEDTTRMGVSIVDSVHGQGLTFSCDACHAGRFLGRSVRGLTNRGTRANAFFVFGKEFLPNIPSDLFQQVTGATDAEVTMLERTTASFRRIGLQTPAQHGLDTSLAQVALSLARRGDGPDAPFDSTRETSPLTNALSEHVADSKPMPWWTLRYKNRWLADGAVVQGNPIFTNILWNELGRGTDLNELEAWLDENAEAIDLLTVAVFASEPPRWTDFFDPATLDLEAAKRGATLFEASCAGCHGSYHKGWDEGLVGTEAFATTHVDYDADLGPIDVGTDPGRYQGMPHFGPRLNELAISGSFETVVEAQQGYVAPPLTGIFARYPYFHNNAVPTLCEVLLPASERTVAFVQGPSELPEDFDADCVGYPVGDAIPERWDQEHAVRAEGPGLSNQGHDDWDFTPSERADLVMFLKTL